MTTAGLAALELPSTAEMISRELRRLIISGALKPGQPLNEQQLAKQLGVSRSPVREALQRLVAERLLTSQRNKSVTVREFTEADFSEIYEARILIESHAAAAVIGRGPSHIDEAIERLEEALRGLRRSLDSGDRFEIAQADQAFHQELVRCGGNSRLVDAYLLLSAETVVCMTWLENARPSGDELMQDHQDFIDALRSGDTERTRRVVVQHLDRANTNLSASSPAERASLNPSPAPHR